MPPTGRFTPDGALTKHLRIRATIEDVAVCNLNRLLNRICLGRHDEQRCLVSLRRRDAREGAKASGFGIAGRQSILLIRPIIQPGVA
jgi:hypothetical protein